MSQSHRARSWFIGPSIAAFAAVVLLAACGSGSQPSEQALSKSGGSVSITLAGSAGAGILPAFAAQQEGYFAKHGLNVKIQTVANPTTLVAGLGHQFQFIETYPTSVISAAAKGISISATGGGQITSPTVLVSQVLVKPGSGITSWAQLQGKRVGSPTTNGIIPVGLKAMVKKQGGDPNAVHLLQVPFANQKAQMESGRVDAVISALPYYTGLVASGYHPLGDPDLDLAGPSTNNEVLGSLWASSRSWASQNPKIVSDFVASIDQADKWIAANSGAAKQLYVKITGLPASLVTNAPLPAYKATVSANDVVPWVGYMKQAGAFAGQVNEKELVFP